MPKSCDMRKALLIVICLFASIPLIRGQVLLSIIFGDKLNSPTTEFGLNVGVAVSTLSGYKDIAYSNNLALGTFFTWKMHDRVQLQPEIYFIFPGGAKDLPPYEILDPEITIPEDDVDVIRSSSYLSLPLLFKIRLLNQIRFIAGPQFSFMTSNTDFMLYEMDKKNNFISRQKDMAQFKRFDAGINAGLSYKLGKGDGVSIEAKFYYGLLDTVQADDINAKNRIFIIQAGIPIRGFSKTE